MLCGFLSCQQNFLILTWNLFLIYLLHFPHRSWQTLQKQISFFKLLGEKKKKNCNVIGQSTAGHWKLTPPPPRDVIKYRTVGRKEKIMENG